MTETSCNLDVVIVGGGVAGLAACVALKQGGICRRLRVFERENDYFKAGHGMLLLENAVADLKKLGVHDSVLKECEPIARLIFRDDSGVTFQEQDFETTFCATRSALMQALYEKSAEHVIFGEKLKNVVWKESHKGQAVDSITFESGLEVGDADLYIFADGVHSKAYAGIDRKGRRPDSRVGELSIMTEIPELAEKLRGTLFKFYFPKMKSAFGLLVPSKGNDVLGYMQWDKHEHGKPRRGARPREIKDFILRALGDLPGPLLEFFRSCDFSQAFPWSTVDADFPAQAHCSNAVLIGDAMHPLLPFTSQGTPSAIEDAIILAKVLSDYSPTSLGSNGSPSINGHNHEIDSSLSSLLGAFISLRREAITPFIKGGRKILDNFVAANDTGDLVAPYCTTENGDDHLSVCKDKLVQFVRQNNGYYTTCERCLRMSLLPQRMGDPVDTNTMKLLEDSPSSDQESPDTQLFNDDMVNISSLKRKAYNFRRWATLSESEKEGGDVIPLTAADADFPVAQPIVQAMQDYVQDGYLCYGQNEGLPEFRQAMSKHCNGQGMMCTEDQVLATNSAARAMVIIAAFALRNPSDEAIIFDPVDFLFAESVKQAGGVIKRTQLYLDPESGHYQFRIEEIKSLISPNTKMLCICNPHNPNGRVWTREELELLGNLAVENDLWIMADEVWCDIVFSPHRFVAVASVSESIASRTFTVRGFSKNYGLSGLRLGTIVAPSSKLAQELAQLSGINVTSCGATTISQVAGVASLSLCQGHLRSWVHHLQECRDIALSLLASIPGISYVAPQGTFVLWIDVSRICSDVEGLTNKLFEDHNVAIVPGSVSFFGPAAKGHVRVAFGTSKKLLREGLLRLTEGLLEAGAT